MRKLNTFLLSILILLVATCMVVGSLYHFTDVFKDFKKGTDTPPSIEVPDIPNIDDVPKVPTEITWTISTPNYGTYTFNKLYIVPEVNNKPSTTNAILLPDTNLTSIKQDIFFENSVYLGSDNIDDFELVVIPEYDILNNTQNNVGGTHINYKEKITASVRHSISHGDIYNDIEMYTLKQNIITYNKPFEDISDNEKRFTLAIYNRLRGIAYLYARLGSVDFNDGEYYFFRSDKNYIFSEFFIENLFIYNE